jgi:hypothetical protein
MRLISTPGELSCLAARRARDFAATFRPFKTEGVGNAGCPVHPQPRARWVVKVAHECSQRRHRKHPAFPHANGFNGFLRALPGDEFLFVTIAPRIERLRAPGWAAKTSARLDISNGCQDHTTSPSATPSKKPLGRLGTSPAEALTKADQRRRLARSMIAHGVTRPARSSRPTLPRPPHPVPTSVTIAIRPSCGTGCANDKFDLGVSRSDLFFAGYLDSM